MKRVIVVGSTGSGKSTFAKALAEKKGLAYIDLDDLHHLPGWKERPTEEFKALLQKAVAAEKWVVAGNYLTKTHDITWPLADTLIWLDMPFFSNLWKLLKRTMTRTYTGELICNGNRETLGKQLFTADSILWWYLKTWRKNRKRYGDMVRNPQAHPHLTVIHFTSYQESADFLKRLA